MTESKLAPPEHVQGSAREWWLAMVQEFSFDDDPAGLQALSVAATQLMRMQQYRAAIEANGGPIIEDRFGYPREHPACVGERAAANLFRLALRELGIASTASDESNRLPRLAFARGA